MLHQTYVSLETAIKLKRSYCTAKSFPFTKAVFDVVYQIPNSRTSEYPSIKSHWNAKKTRVIEKPFTRIDNKVLSRPKKSLRENAMSSKNVYDCINKESDGVFESHSQSKELRNV